MAGIVGATGVVGTVAGAGTIGWSGGRGGCVVPDDDVGVGEEVGPSLNGAAGLGVGVGFELALLFASVSGDANGQAMSASFIGSLKGSALALNGFIGVVGGGDFGTGGAKGVTGATG